MLNNLREVGFPLTVYTINSNYNFEAIKELSAESDSD